MASGTRHLTQSLGNIPSALLGLGVGLSGYKKLTGIDVDKLPEVLLQSR